MTPQPTTRPNNVIRITIVTAPGPLVCPSPTCGRVFQPATMASSPRYLAAHCPFCETTHVYDLDAGNYPVAPLAS
jgi:hypothetical protein